MGNQPPTLPPATVSRIQKENVKTTLETIEQQYKNEGIEFLLSQIDYTLIREELSQAIKPLGVIGTQKEKCLASIKEKKEALKAHYNKEKFIIQTKYPSQYQKFEKSHKMSDILGLDDANKRLDDFSNKFLSQLHDEYIKMQTEIGKSRSKKIIYQYEALEDQEKAELFKQVDLKYRGLQRTMFLQNKQARLHFHKKIQSVLKKQDEIEQIYEEGVREITKKKREITGGGDCCMCR